MSLHRQRIHLRQSTGVSRIEVITRALICTFTLAILSACGDQAAFTEVSADGEQDPNQRTDSPGGQTPESGNPENPETPVDPRVETQIDPQEVELPNLDKEDGDAVRACLAAWGKVPFGNTIQVRKINAAIVIGGFGNAVNDTVRTAEPELVLINAGINIAADVNYKLLNPNAYYCMKLNVNFDSNLVIDLHCQARLADTKFSLEVDSNVDPGAANVGINIGSNVTLNNVIDDSAQCIR